MQKTLKRVLAVGLSSVMAVSAFSISAAAYNGNYQSETHTVFKHTEQTLAPGVEYYNNYAYLNDGEQVVYYAAVADINREDVLVQGGYWNEQTEQYGMAKLTEQAAAANAKFSDPNNEEFISENYTVVAGTNGDFYNMQTGRPSGAFAINGKIMNNANNRPWFAIFADNTALCGANDAEYNAAIAEHGAVQNSVGGSQMLVENGVDVTANASGSYNTDRHSRTMIGVTADNKVVSVVVDGRQSPFSDGGSMHELAQIMIEAECVTAINLDGGGSTTFGARPEGEDSFKVINRPSDGSERSISSGVLIASLAAPSNVFDRVSMKVADEYVTPGTQTTIEVTGVSTSGASAEIPAEVTYSVTNGTFADGVFTAGNAAEDAVVTAMYNGEAVGSATVHVVIPDTVAFDQATFTIPYGKTVALGITAKYGLNKVVTKPADFNFALETATGAGEIVDGAVVAPAEGAEATGNVVTATLIADNTKTTTANIAFGKASVVLFDFEDGTTQNWVRYNTTNYNYIRTRGTTSNVTAENGQVHSGEHALKLEAKFSETWEAGYISGRAGVYGLPEVIDLKGATRIGMWMYIPVANATFNGRIFMCKVTERDEETGAITNYEGYYTATQIDKGGDWNCGFVTQYDEPGWHYVYFDLGSDSDWCVIKNHCLLDFYINDRNGDAYGFNHLNYTNQNADMNLYIDDVTVDYSSVVEDRERPIFSEVKLGDDGNYSNEGLTLERGTNYVSDGFNRIDLSARVADDTAKNNYSGLNADTAKVYLDGVEFPCTFSNGIITAPTKVYTNGKHTVKFAIEDNAGNYASAIRTFTVANTDNDQPVWIEAKDPNADKILLGSLYWVNVKALNPDDVTAITMDLDLDNLSVWELDHMEIADGFDAEYSIVNADENIARLVITANGDDMALLDGDAIVSMPIRTWQLPIVAADYGHAGVVWMYDKYRAGNEVWPVNVIVNVAAGQVEFESADNEVFTGEEVNVRTESIYWDNDNSKASDPYYKNWNGGHDHRAETAQYYAATATNHTQDGEVVVVEGFEPVAATCTEDGFSGRYFCTVCNSISDWGHVIPATGHTYEIDETDGLMKCKDCNELCNTEVDGKMYVDGALAQGFVDNKYYIDGVAQDYDGIVDIDGVYYEFDNGLSFGKYTGLIEQDGKYYYAQLGELSSGWKMIDDEWYYFDATTMNPVETLNNGKVTYEFEENGKLVEGKWYITDAGRRYYYGPSYYKHGWQTIDGDEYYFGDANKNPGYCYTGKRYVINSNSYTPQWYDFGEEGKAVMITDTGFLTTDAGTYYLVNGVSQTGLQLVDEKYYYFANTYQAKSGLVHVSVNKNNGLLPEGYYLFGDDFAMVDGEFAEWNGAERWIVLGQPCFAGVMQDNNGIYYIGSDATQKTGLVTVSNGKGNGILENGTYMFGDDGYLANNTFGIWQGKRVYLENGQPSAVGPVVVAGKKYYIRSSCEPATGLYHVSASRANDVLAEGTYLFGEDGALVDGEFADWKGTELYIKDGQPKAAGVIDYNGTLVYVDSSCKRKTGIVHITNASGNGILTEGYYLFTDDGLADNEFGTWTNGKTYYFANGQRTAAGVVEIDGNIYFINGNCQAATGNVHVTAAKGNSILDEGDYFFGEDGILVPILAQ